MSSSRPCGRPSGIFSTRGACWPFCLFRLVLTRLPPSLALRSWRVGCHLTGWFPPSPTSTSHDALVRYGGLVCTFYLVFKEPRRCALRRVPSLRYRNPLQGNLPILPRPSQPSQANNLHSKRLFSWLAASPCRSAAEGQSSGHAAPDRRQRVELANLMTVMRGCQPPREM